MTDSTLDYATLCDRRDVFNDLLSKIVARLNQYPKNAIGLTLDHAKDAEWGRLRAEYARIDKLAKSNTAVIVKRFAKLEIAARDARRAEKLRRQSAA